MRFESQNSGVCSCTHCRSLVPSHGHYSASESILEEVSETVMCGDCMQNYTCRCHLTCEESNNSIDVVNPHHYTRLTPEPIEVIEAWNLPYHDATALKYISRHREKGGAEDIRKAVWFLQRILETEYREQV